MAARPVALLAAASLGLAGCAAGAAGPPIGDAAPLPIIRAAQSSVGAAPEKASARRRSRIAATSARQRPRTAEASARRRPAIARGASLAAKPTRPGPRRPRAAAPATAVPLSEAARLAAPACAQYEAALAGRYPDAVRARGPERALALMTESVAAALAGLPIKATRSSAPARAALDAARARLAEALAAQDPRTASAIAHAAAPRIRAYAAAIGIASCG